MKRVPNSTDISGVITKAPLTAPLPDVLQIQTGACCVRCRFRVVDPAGKANSRVCEANERFRLGIRVWGEMLKTIYLTTSKVLP